MIQLERIGTVIAVAFLLTRVPFFRRLISKGEITWREKFYLVAVFGLFGILGTYMGIPVEPRGFVIEYGGPVSQQQAIANSRVVGAFVAGLLGGPWVGLLAGLLAGVHRYFLGGFTCLACGLSTVVEGFLGGLIGRRYGGVHIRLVVALVAGVAAETLQMLIILFLARPFSQALALVELIALPMIVTNAVGIAAFMLIIQNVLADEEKAGAVQAHKALKIADLTISFLKRGLNYASAEKTAQIIFRILKPAAVAITDREKILVHLGLGADHHKAGLSMRTAVTREVITTGKLQVAYSREEVGCDVKGCPLGSAVIVPLKRREEVVGTLKLYFKPSQKITAVDREIAQGLGHLFSTQLELARLEEQERLLTKAENKALQAQINPHFLFNSLNVIVSLCRTEPETARKLLVHLGDFFRQNFQTSQRELVTLKTELAHIRSYLAIEQVRFGEKLKVHYVLDPSTLEDLLPPLTLQPLVENAVKHGLQPLKNGGEIIIKSTKEDSKTVISVCDNGVGIPPEKLESLLVDQESDGGTGIGLNNVHKRLLCSFGEESGLEITSDGRGTAVTIILPSRN